jgi:sigma-B regulation protein RsbU (phosphoserine phosphatase)
MTIRTKILLILIPGILILLGILIIFSFDSSKKTVLTVINNEAHEIARSRVMEFDLVFETSQKIAEGLATSIGTMNEFNNESVNDVIQQTLSNNPNVYGSTVAFLPDKTHIGLYAPYYYQTPKGLKYQDLATESYNYPEKDWFSLPIKNNKGMWSKPYYDEGGGDILMITYSAPIHRKDDLIGIATVDISLDDIVKRTRKLTIGGKGFAFILTADGYFIAHPEMAELSNQTITQIAETTNNKGYKTIARINNSPDTSFIEIEDPIHYIPGILLKTKLNSMNWNLYIVYPRNKILAPLNELTHSIILISVIVVLLMIGLVYWLTLSLTRPFTDLVEQAGYYSKGIYDHKINDNTGPKEIRELSKTFNNLGEAITEQIENVKETTAQKERYHQELLIAAEIQQSILPGKFPPFPELVTMIDLYGLTRPAKEIGGDFYDFFKLTENKIAIVIGDVSDKGAPSSFFMAMTRMLVREIATRNLSPAEVIRRVNHMLAQDNPHCMFVTLIYGEYDFTTGNIKLVNAGHNRPVLLKASGKVKKIELNTNLPLGIMPDTYYESNEQILYPGETLVLYTDGITEAANPTGVLYGTERLINTLEGHKNITAEELSKTLLASVDNYTTNLEQHDDITLLCLKNNKIPSGKEYEQKNLYEKSTSLILPAQLTILEQVANTTELITRQAGFDDKQIQQINLALDEVITNIIMHSYNERQGEKLVIEFIPRTDGICIEVKDYGKPFEFDKKSDQYNPEDASVDQPVGGIGLFLAKKSVDLLEYEPSTLEGNKIKIIKYFEHH